jgi:hypothetical protein
MDFTELIPQSAVEAMAIISGFFHADSHGFVSFLETTVPVVSSSRHDTLCLSESLTNLT